MGDGLLPDWLVLVAVLGHVSWLLWIDNRIHAKAWDYRLIKLLGMGFKAAIVVGSVGGVAWWLARALGAPSFPPMPLWIRYYVVACALNTVLSTVPWLIRRLTFRDADVLLSDKARIVDLRSALDSPAQITGYTRRMSAIPGNQLLSVSIHEKRLSIPRLPATLDGLRVVHLSDIHMTGRIAQPFYDRLVDLANDADADLVLLSGDLIENTKCWDWIPDTFGRLRSRHGAYFVLGNHDVRIDHHETRRRLEAAGLVNLGKRLNYVTIRGVDVLLFGNERPWIDDAESTPPATTSDKESFRILLSHSPDEYPWARLHDFDLMLAGHVHGGQIRIPPIGPILAPSRYGVRYACGVFYEPPTVMHVSRGTSSKAPFRFFCPPELTTLILSPPG